MIHTSREVGLALASRLEMQIQFLPKYACCLNHALYEGVAYWNDQYHPYRWKKRPQEQLPVPGGFCVIFCLVASLFSERTIKMPARNWWTCSTRSFDPANC
jgi:hypothetical protein